MAVEHVFVLDACAIIAFLHDEEGAEKVEEILAGAENRCLVHGINACEVYYDLLLRGNEKDAAVLEGILKESGAELDSSLTADFWKSAGIFKAQLRRVSLADCMALALTVKNGATLVTSDHHEFDRVAQEGICPILFLR